MELDLNDVALLVRVVETRSFSAAARERGIPVSTVSRRVARLEAALGTRLLERTTRTLRLTEPGRAYFDHATRAIDDLARGAGQLRERQAEPRGRVRVLAPTWLAGAVANVLYRYLAEHPRVSIDLELDPRSVDLLAQGFDVAIVAGKLEDTSDFVARRIWPASPKRLFASPRYIRAHGMPKRIDDLIRHDCISTRARDGFAKWTLVNGRTKRSLTIAPRLYVSEIAVAHRAAVAGLGIAMLPEFLSANDVTRKRLIPILEGWQSEAGGVHLLHRAHRSMTAAVRTCIDHFLLELPGKDPGHQVDALVG